MDSADTFVAASAETALLAELARQLRALADHADHAGCGGPPVTGRGLCDGRCALVLRYRAQVHEAIEALERTRASFKSRELGALRRRLVEFLEDAAAGERGGLRV